MNLDEFESVCARREAEKKAQLAAITPHVRQRQPSRAPPTSWTAERSPPNVRTLCGETPTIVDWDIRSALVKKHRAEAERVLCPKCLGLALTARDTAAE